MSRATHPSPLLRFSPSSKRKLDDYASSDDDNEDTSSYLSELVRMRKDDSALHSSTGKNTNIYARNDTCYNNINRLQFFVKMINKGKSLVIQANCNDTVRSIHERIYVLTGIPVIEQRLIYRGKQLQCEKTLVECDIQNDSGLQLVGRMRSTEHPEAWQRIDDMVSTIWRVFRGENDGSALKNVKSQLYDFLQKTPKNDCESAASHIMIFASSSAPAALVMLYMSGVKGNKECAEYAIRYFIDTCRNFPKPIYGQYAPIVLEFCKLLCRFKSDDPLYLFCRSTLGALVENVGVVKRGSNVDENKGLIALREIFPYVSEIATRLSKDLMSSMELPLSLGPAGPLLTDVQDFTSFTVPLKLAIEEHISVRGRTCMPITKDGFKHPRYGEEIEFLHGIYTDLLDKMATCLQRMEDCLASGESAVYQSGWSHYLIILKELTSISKLYEGEENRCQTIIRLRMFALRALVFQYAKRGEDNAWLLDYKDVLDFESRRHLSMLLFPDVKEDYEELHEMLIDRSELLPESFEYIAHADPAALHAGLFMEFKNEEATGPGVLREWFFLVCKALFNPQNALFVPCPNDRRRFFPNPASRVDPMHLDYFSFSGRVIALALMHKVHVGVVLDRVFFKQLAGSEITLEDIKDADPLMYYSCKKVLEMDPEFIDSDALGLTFVTEVEELGSRIVVELCPDGKSKVVDSTNREEYVKLLIDNRFVKSTYEQVSRFSQGFADIISSSSLLEQFFRVLEIEDFDRMLHGCENDISVEDWMAHTDYNGYKETDPQIFWFWKIVGEMTAEQKRVLLFFWTSVKYLPAEGFGGLASRLYLYNSPGPTDRLPASHTCFYRLCVPHYRSMEVMQDRLRIITQEDFGCSFGTW